MPKPTTMLAAVFAGQGRLEMTERPVPLLEAPDDVLVEVEACGVCGTDVHILATPPGHPATPGTILGHELVGVVREAGPEAIGVTAGDRVVIEANHSCRRCRWCKRGLTNHCENFTSMGIFRDGGLAPWVVAPAWTCHRIGADLPRRLAALIEPVSCVVNGVQQARLVPGEAVAVIGGGPVGLIFAALFRAAGAGTVAVVEPTAVRLDVAKQLGADVAVDPGAGDPVDAVMEATDGMGADVVVDAVGSQLATGLGMVRKGGRVLLFGMSAHAPPAQVHQFDITRNELTVFGTYVGTHTFPPAVRILSEGVVDLSPMVSHFLPLAQLPEALDAIRSGDAVKAVIDVAGAGA